MLRNSTYILEIELNLIHFIEIVKPFIDLRITL